MKTKTKRKAKRKIKPLAPPFCPGQTIRHKITGDIYRVEYVDHFYNMFKAVPTAVGTFVYQSGYNSYEAV